MRGQKVGRFSNTENPWTNSETPEPSIPPRRQRSLLFILLSKPGIEVNSAEH